MLYKESPCDEVEVFVSGWCPACYMCWKTIRVSENETNLKTVFIRCNNTVFTACKRSRLCYKLLKNVLRRKI